MKLTMLNTNTCKLLKRFTCSSFVNSSYFITYNALLFSKLKHKIFYLLLISYLK